MSNGRAGTSARSMRRAREREIERAERRERRLSGRARAGLLTGAALGATVVFAPSAGAATFTVNTLTDSDDGTCADADCSLREAVDEANGDAAADDIVFASGLSGSIALTSPSGDIPINAATTITGPGAGVLAVSGVDTTQIFDIDANLVGATYDPVTISGLRLEHGSNVGTGGAIESDNATLTLDGMTFADNESTASAGGAIHTDTGNLFISHSTFTGNTSNSWGGALYLEDTQNTPADDVEFRVSDSVFTDNSANGGGGGGIDIDNPHGDSVVENTLFSGNHASGEGGGITVNETLEPGADVTVRNSTLVDNSATTGGGFYSELVEGQILIDNTTISGNQADEQGGGVYFAEILAGQEAVIRNSTIVNNTAGLTGNFSGGGVYEYETTDDGSGDQPNGPAVISSTIVYGNTADSGNDLSQGTFTNGFAVDNSLIGDPAGAVITGANNLTGVDPQLGPLTDNGGPTPTFLPALTSPAVDAGVANGLTTDQRGLPRTADLSAIANNTGSDGTDIGAVELAGAACQGATVPPKDGTDAGESIAGSGDADSISALGGNDTVTAGGGNDCVSGGDGNDKASGQGGKDQIKGDAGKDNLSGGGGKDKVVGGDGKDTVKGGGGADKLKGNAGKDKIKARGGGKDKVNCGAGKDKAIVDSKDKVAKNCERVDEK